MNIRSFTPNDYQAIANIHNSLQIVWPEAPTTGAARAEADQRRSPKCKYGRWVAVADGRVVGHAAYGQSAADNHPQKFHINVEVSPPYQHQGIGSALYDRLMDGLQTLDPRILRADAFTNLPQGFPFLQKRGFFEAWRETPVHLDLAVFDPRPYADLEPRLRREGIEIRTLVDLQGDPERDRKLFALYLTIDRSLPAEEDHSPDYSFEDWQQWGLNNSGLLSDAYFVALHSGEYIGLRELGKEPGGVNLLGGLLGVLPAYRQRGIGLAMQLRGIAYARQHGYRLLKTCTGAVNAPMQSLFTKLGYVRDPEWLQCQKNL